MRLIDADALIAKFKDDVENLQEFAFQLATIGAINTVKHQPTVDAAPVIRCKDCKYYDNEDYGEPTRYCTWHESVVNADDYCSYGEREESE